MCGIAGYLDYCSIFILFNLYGALSGSTPYKENAYNFCYLYSMLSSVDVLPGK